ncbi:hypothetical protein A3715_11295 [Oleiphilus sp. HI0009]|nr:hypothetical protein A3715_11295 [Oleiphilus sp. HI0009]
MRSNRKYGTPIYDEKGFPLELYGKVKLGDSVTWLGRKQGSCSEDDKFKAGNEYKVVMIYPTNFDLEIELSDSPPHVTIRAGQDEYRLVK